MKTRNLMLRTGMALLVVLVAGSCSGGIDPAWVNQTGLYLDAGGTQPTDAYSWLDAFYLVVNLGEIPQDAVVQASWIAVDTNRAEPDTVIKIEEQPATNQRLVFELKNEGNFWPIGEYQVNIYINGELYQVLEFEVYHTDIS